MCRQAKSMKSNKPITESHRREKNYSLPAFIPISGLLLHRQIR